MFCYVVGSVCVELKENLMWKYLKDLNGLKK